MGKTMDWLRRKPSMRQQWLWLAAIIVLALLVNYEVPLRFWRVWCGQTPPKSKLPPWSLSCVCTADNALGDWIDARRGANYGLDCAAKPRCAVTVFNLSHAVTYFGAGFLAPDLVLPAMVLSSAWELLEATPQVQCQCVTDLLWNFGGFALGSFLRQQITR